MSESNGSGHTIKLGGTTYLLSPVSVIFLKQHDAWLKDCRDRYLKSLTDPVQEAVELLQGIPDALMPPEAKQEHMREALEERKKLRDPSKFYQSLAESMEGIARQLWYSIRPQHPEISLERCIEFVDQSNWLEVQEILDRVNRMDEIARRFGSKNRDGQPETTETENPTPMASETPTGPPQTNSSISA